MLKQSQIKAYFKIKTADEMEVEELLFTQASIASRTTTLETVTLATTLEEYLLLRLIIKLI
jgi:hypothetical protein